MPDTNRDPDLARENGNDNEDMQTDGSSRGVAPGTGAPGEGQPAGPTPTTGDTGGSPA